MSWWFPRFNLLGELASGNGELWIQGQSKGPGYSPDWIESEFLIVPSPETGGMTSIMRVNGQREILAWAFSPRIGNISGVGGGFGNWCGWSEASGLIFNGIEIDTIAAAGSVDRRTGKLSYLSPYQSTSRRVVVDGVTVRQACPADEIRAADGATLWKEFHDGLWKLWGCIGQGQALARSPLPNDEPEFAGIPVLLGDKIWIVLQTAKGIVVFPWGNKDGYILEGDFYFPDAIASPEGGSILIAATTAQGALVLEKVDVSKPRTDLSQYHPSGGGEVPEQPRITITDYNPKEGQAPLQVKAIAQLSGGPADRLIWSQSKDNGPWQVVAPNNAPDDPDHTYKFDTPGSYNLKVRVEGPGGSDETGSPRIVSVSAKPVDPPVRSGRRFWFGPNIGSTDMLRLFQEPDLWNTVRGKIDIFKFYLQHILDVGGSIGPNNYQAFKDAGAFAFLKKEGIPIAVEMGSVKEGNCDARRSVEMMQEAQQKISDAGGRLDIITMDEPLVAGLGPCNMAVPQVADGTAYFIRKGKDFGISVGWIEAWPHVSVDQMGQFLQELDKRGGRPTFWHLDVDRKRAQSEGKSLQAMVNECKQQAADRSIPLGIILVGYPHNTDAEYVADVRAWSQEAHRLWDKWDQVIVQSWAVRGESDVQDIPLNVPESDPTKHTNLLADVIEVHA